MSYWTPSNLTTGKEPIMDNKQDLKEEIARVGYEIYEQTGISGPEVENWLEAERIVLERLSMRESSKAAKKLVPFPIVFIVMLCFLWISCLGEVYGKTLYEYVDKDGPTVITDIQPSGGKFKTIEVPTKKTEEKKVESGNRPNKQAKEAAAKGNEKREKIKALEEKLRKAEIDEQNYRSNMNQASGFSQRHHWRVQVDKQLELIKKTEKEIEELKRRP
jgi:hypothetical protein